MPSFHFLKLYLNIILPSTPGSSKWFFPYQNPVWTSPPHVLHAHHLILLDLITWIIFDKEYRLLNSLCRFSTSLLSHTSQAQMSSSALFSSNYSQPNFVPQFGRPCLTPIQNNGQIYLKLYIFLYQPGRQKILHWMISSIRDFNLPLIFFLNTILVHYGFSPKVDMLWKFGWRGPKVKLSRNTPERSPPFIFCY